MGKLHIKDYILIAEILVLGLLLANYHIPIQNAHGQEAKEPSTYVWIATPHSWSGAIAANFDSVSYDGTGELKIPLDCSSGQIYSAVIQKGTAGGTALTVKIVIHDKIVD